uniref:Photosystem I reaction center subunit VIII n=1 Tax=Chamaegastrodia inverta TaxID=2761821 RepID=A0A8F5S296_9ASPA|nr:photosystem I reaction center subunit VIII [Chamaegastrodia inverta]
MINLNFPSIFVPFFSGPSLSGNYNGFFISLCPKK